MKKTLVFITVFCMVMSMMADTVLAASYMANKPPLSMQIMGKKAATAPILYKNKVFVSLRTIGQALGYQVNYSKSAKTMDLVSKTSNITVTVGYVLAKVNKSNVRMDIAPVMSNNQVYVPLSFVEKNFKYQVKFVSNKNVVVIDKLSTGTTSASVVPTTQKPAAASNAIYVLDKKVNSTEKALLKNGVVYVPLRQVAEGLGYKAAWSSATKTMTLTKQTNTMLVAAGKTNATVNKKSVKLDGTPYLSGGRLYAPISIISKNFGYAVSYDNKLNNVSVAQKKTATKPETPKTEVPVPPKQETPKTDAPKTDGVLGIANIVDIIYDESAGFPQVKIVADSAMGAFQAVTASNPDILTIDIPGTLAKTAYESKDINNEIVKKVKINQYSTAPELSRVTLELSNHKPYKIVQSDDKKTISVIYANIIAPIIHQKEDAIDVITLSGTADLEVNSFELSATRRLVVDVNKAIFDDPKQNIKASSGLLKQVRIAQFNQSTARVVFEISDNAYYKVETQGNISKIYLSQYPFEFVGYSRDYINSMVFLNPGKDVQYSTAVDEVNRIVKIIFPEDYKIEGSRKEINDSLIKYIDIATENLNGIDVTTASIQMQEGVAGEIVSPAVSKLIKIRFKRKITALSQITVVVDAGHGGKDPGARSGGVNEKDLNLDVALRVEKYLKSLGINTIMTRGNDTFIELTERAGIANRNNADFFLSIHFNAFNSTANGIETLYYPNSPNEILNFNFRSIAQIVQSEMLKATKRAPRGVNARSDLAVLRHTKMPAILAELGFITHAEELKLIKTDKYKEDCARALTVSMLKYFRDMQGVPMDIDPESLYALPYNDTMLLQQTIGTVPVQVIETAPVEPIAPIEPVEQIAPVEPEQAPVSTGDI